VGRRSIPGSILEGGIAGTSDCDGFSGVVAGGGSEPFSGVCGGGTTSAARPAECVRSIAMKSVKTHPLTTHPFFLTT
jgi:hypothetical protein